MFEQRKSDLGLDTRRILTSAIMAVVLPAVAGTIATCWGNGDGFFLYLFGTLIVAVIIRQIVADWRRGQEMRRLAQTLRFTYIGSALPPSFPLFKTSSRTARNLRNVCVSDTREREVLFFDCELGHGRGRWHRTVVALRGPAEDFGGARFGPDLAKEEIGDWAMVYGTSRQLEPIEILALVSGALQTSNEHDSPSA